MTLETNLTAFTAEDIKTLDVELKIGILGTVTPEGLPHLTMISSLRPYREAGLVWGQFTEGASKSYIRENPRTGFLIMSLDKEMWLGKANFTHTAQNGPEYDNYNNLNMFRYNAYFGVHTVYYMDLLQQSGKIPLPMGKVIAAAVGTIIARALGRKDGGKEILNPWTRGLLNQLDSLKFLSYIGEDGYPVILPLIQAQALDTRQVIFSRGLYAKQIDQIPPGAPVAVFGLALSMEDVLLRGIYRGTRSLGGVKCGVVEANWVYNSMPPTPGQIYPPLEIQTVAEF